MDEIDREEFFKYLYRERQLGDRTIKVYMIFHNLFDPFHISQPYINEFILEHHNTTIVRAFVKHYLEHRGLSEQFKLPKRSIGKKPQRIIRSITQTDFEKVKKYFYDSSFKDGLMFDLIYQGALRRVEIITLTLGSFFWNEWFEDTSSFCKLVIWGKGKKERIVLINPETTNRVLEHFVTKFNLFTEKMIKDFFNSNGGSFLFTKSGGKELTEKDVYDKIKKLSKEALGRDIRPHEIRHFRATELERKGVFLRDIKNYLGHSKLATTEIYLHKSGEESLDNIEKLIK